MAEKEVTMNLKVDVKCKKCMKKVKKVLSKFPEIREQKTDEKQNLVIIKVVCFDPEKIRDEICCKSECSIKTIVIVPTPKPPKQPSPPKSPKCPPKPPKCPPKHPPPACSCGSHVPCSCFHCYCGCHDGRPFPCYCGCHHGSTCEQSASVCKIM